jgi:phage terminase small subunit
MREKLTPKQQRFCEEFMVDMKGTQAAIRAGYSPKAARFQSSRMLTNVDVQQYLNELRSQQQERLEINADAVLKELANPKAVRHNRSN